MKRPIVLLFAVLALVLAACSSDTPDATATATSVPTSSATPEQTAEPTETASESPEPTEDDDSGTTGSLVEALPEEVGGFERVEVPGIEEMIGPMLQQQGIDTEDADFAFASYGEGDVPLIVTAIRMPGMDEAQLTTLARLISSSQAGAGADVEAEPVTVGGKDVLRVTPEGQEGSVYIYLTGDAVFTVVGPSAELAEELLEQLP